MAGSTTSHSDDGASIVLALGGGGARGLAQIGVIEVLQARGLYIEAVAGTSCGALVGGAFAAGKLAGLGHVERSGRLDVLGLRLQFGQLGLS